MKSRLLWKVSGLHILVIVVVVVAVCSAIDTLAARYYTALMHEYSISPKVVHGMFLEALHRYVDGTGVLASVLAVILSLLVTRQVLGPLGKMTEMTKQIAAGNYSQRLQISSKDELGQLSANFNQMAESLQRIERLRKTMVNDLGHELRTPLTNLRAQVEALNDGVVAPTREVFESLLEEIMRLVRLVDDLARLARAEAAGVSLNLEMLDVPTLFNQVLSLFRPKFAEKSITVETNFPQETNRVLADSHRLSQAVSNLLDNACEYTEQGGRLRIEAERLPHSIQFSFSNTGEGINQEDLPFIFERFYRAEKSRSRDHGGAGLGLSIVKDLIEAHGGQVGAESSESETRVWFRLPL